MVVLSSPAAGCPLPCRYVLKSQMKELLELEAKNAISIEEEIENERKKVDAKTPITEEVFPPILYVLHHISCILHVCSSVPL